MTDESPLGRNTPYIDRYDASLLHTITRARCRRALGLDGPLPFAGEDVWNAWEVTWLAANGQPRVAVAEIRVPADSDNIVESKSLKLYLNSLSMTRYDSAGAVRDVIARDLSAATGAAVSVTLDEPSDFEGRRTSRLQGVCIDAADVDCDAYAVDAGLLESDPSRHADESVHSHLLRSLCPVTSQPDSGSVLIRYSGPAIDHAALLRYIVSYRNHNDFHEACVERMFVDLLSRCRPDRLAVYARYQRRGGIDINPYRSTDTDRTDNLRLWRQ